MRPLLFIYDMHNNEGSAKHFVINNTDFLKSMGYKVLCLEYPSNLNLEKALEFSHKAYTQAKSMLEKLGEPSQKNAAAYHEALDNFKIAKNNFLLLLNVYNKKSYIYQGIDHSLTHQLNELSVMDRSTEQMISLRDSLMLEQLKILSQIYGTGLIVIIGLKHHNVQLMVEKELHLPTVACFPFKGEALFSEASEEQIRSILESRPDIMSLKDAKEEDKSLWLTTNVKQKAQSTDSSSILDSLQKTHQTRQLFFIQNTFSSTDKQTSTLLQNLLAEHQLLLEVKDEGSRSGKYSRSLTTNCSDPV
jgi:hypothetical protein